MSFNMSLVLLAGLYLPSTLSAQDSCTALLQHGIYDKLAETGAASSRSKADEGICRAYHQYESDSTHADASGNYYEVISGNGSFTGTQIKSLGEEMCEHHSTDNSASNYGQIDKQIISPAAVQAWSECTRNNLLSTATIFKDTDQGTRGLTLSFHLASGGNDATVNSVVAENLQCTSPTLGPLINKDGTPIPLGLKAYGLDCTRTISDAPFQSGSRKVYAESAHLNVDTSVGNITRDLPAILPEAPFNPIPFGTIVAWYSTTGPIPAGWKLCDGTGGTPDLRDKFVRGTGKYEQVGSPGGSDQLSIPSIDLTVGQPDYIKGLRVADGNGVINHHSMGGGLVDSFTVPTKIPLESPPYISLVYIIRQ
jgi:hypothetical protein